MLTGVELRKMIDTRAGFWLLLTTVLGALALAGTQLRWNAPADITFAGLFEALTVPAMLLLPILGVLTVTGESSHRPVLTTFLLVPQRLRIVAAKVGAGGVLGAASWLLCLLAAAGANLVGMGLERGTGDWRVPLSLMFVTLLWQVAFIVMGVAFGLLLGSAVMAVTTLLVLPLAWDLLISSRSSLTEVGSWLSPDGAFDALTTDASSLSTWAHALTGALLWVGLPLFLGSLRLLRREIT